jgi:hypothetical protein
MNVGDAAYQPAIYSGIADSGSHASNHVAPITRVAPCCCNASGNFSAEGAQLVSREKSIILIDFLNFTAGI